MVQTGNKAVIYATHGYNTSLPVWTVVKVSSTGKQITLESTEGKTIKAIYSNKYGTYKPANSQYSALSFEGETMYERCVKKTETEQSETTETTNPEQRTEVGNYTHKVGENTLEIKELAKNEWNLIVNGKKIGQICTGGFETFFSLRFDNLQGAVGSKSTRYACANAILHSLGMGGTPSDDLYVSSMNYPY